MKKLLVMCAMTLFVGIAAKAQIGESASKKIETTVIRFCLKTATGFSQVSFGWQTSINISIM